MTAKKDDGTPRMEAPQDVERIRDIIFGSQMRDYEQKFQIFQRDLDRLQQELNRLADQLIDNDGGQNKKLQNLRQEMRQADDEVRSELRQTAEKLMTDKVDRLVLGELFIELGSHLKTGGSLTDLLQGLTDNTAQ